MPSMQAVQHGEDDPEGERLMPVTDDPSDPRLREVDPDGMQRAYLVLPDGQRRQLVRPVRRSYRHEKCGTVTTMGQALAETYAVDPSFYGATYCVACRGHFPVGAAGEFVWEDGSKVGT